MKTTDEQREKIILGIADMLRNHGFTFEFKVMKKPRGIRIIHEVTQEEMDAIARTAAKEHQKEE
jgi:hypothetical protein